MIPAHTITIRKKKIFLNLNTHNTTPTVVPTTTINRAAAAKTYLVIAAIAIPKSGFYSYNIFITYTHGSI